MRLFSGSTLLRDALPTEANYGSPTIQNLTDVAFSVDCSINSQTVLRCAASTPNPIFPFTIDPGGSFEVVVPVTPGSSSAGANLDNPISGGECEVNPNRETPNTPPGFFVIEQDETNNSCSDSVSVVPPPDDDKDGVPDDVEDGAPNDGDGNSDGVPDSEQAHVTSFPDASGKYVTVAAPAGTTLKDVQIVPNPSPGNAPSVSFPLGFLDFELEGLSPGASVIVDLTPHSALSPNTYWRYGPTPRRVERIG